MQTAKYYGGPLDGATIARTAGRWPIYRDDTGQPITTRQGDREWFVYGQTNPARYYLHQAKAEGARVVAVYVHATVWKSWKEGPK